MALLAALILLAPAFDTFDGPLDPARWYVGVPRPPAKGALTLPRGGWIVSRGIEDMDLEAIEVVYLDRGGQLEVTFHDAKEPLSSPVGDRLLVPRGKGERVLMLGGPGARLDGAALDWKGSMRGTFRLASVGGAIEVQEVRVAPRVPDPEPLGILLRRTVHAATTPPIYRDAQGAYSRVSISLWDVEVCLLLRRGATRFAPLAAEPAGSPVLGALASLGHGGELAAKAAAHPLAMRDWGDETRNLGREDLDAYLAGEYEVLQVLQLAQRALNAALPGRSDLEPLVYLAAVRHADNARAALALAETQGAKGVLAAVKKALGPKEDLLRASSEQLRAAAAAAARTLLGEPPAEWPGFDFDPKGRYATLQQARELCR